jgi:hypothetical protein
VNLAFAVRPHSGKRAGWAGLIYEEEVVVAAVREEIRRKGKKPATPCKHRVTSI